MTERLTATTDLWYRRGMNEEEKKPRYIPIREQADEVTMLYARLAELKDENEKLRAEVRNLRILMQGK